MLLIETQNFLIYLEFIDNNKLHFNWIVFVKNIDMSNVEFFDNSKTKIDAKKNIKKIKKYVDAKIKLNEQKQKQNKFLFIVKQFNSKKIH